MGAVYEHKHADATCEQVEIKVIKHLQEMQDEIDNLEEELSYQ